MAITNDEGIVPDDRFSERSLPTPLRETIERIFKDNPHQSAYAIVGGTSLAGYYAGHRRSDDIDLFAQNTEIFDQLTRYMKSLEGIGVHLQIVTQQRDYFKALAKHKNQAFTIDVVKDSNLFREGVGAFRQTARGVLVPTPLTLLKMKAGTLISRCSEKDLFDLIWLTRRLGAPTTDEWTQLGSQIDGAVTAESILICLTTTALRPEACDFAESHTLHTMSREKVFEKVSSYKVQLTEQFRAHLEEVPVQNVDISELLTEIHSRNPDWKNDPRSPIATIREALIPEKSAPNDMCEHCKLRPREKGRKKYCKVCGRLSDSRKLS